MEKDIAGTRIIHGLEQLVKTAASKVLMNELIICNRAVKWWDEEVECNTSMEKGTRKICNEENYGRVGGVC